MLTLKDNNVNGLYHAGVNLLRNVGQRDESRAGPVLVMPHPILSVYRQPTERVLFDPRRDANPFFHLMESLWMLAGRNDAAFLNNYISDFGSRFGEKDGTIHGAYGHRWRRAFSVDQLDIVVQKLRDNHKDRQAVIQMWDAYHTTELEFETTGDHHGWDDLTGTWKDRPCNTHIYLRVLQQRSIRGGESTYDDVLDLTVNCRSNDIVFGAYGANAVHFSMLQEYLAGRIGVEVGTMYQFSNNWHGYVEVMNKVEPTSRVDMYQECAVKALPIGKERWDLWDTDLQAFMAWHDGYPAAPLPVFFNTWFNNVACRAVTSHRLFKGGDKDEAMRVAERIEATDWALACSQWIGRRIK